MMRSSFTAMALAFGIVTVTALPAMAAEAVQDSSISNKYFQVEVKGMYDKGVGGDEVGTLTPDESVPGTSSIDEAPGSEAMGILIENKPAEFKSAGQAAAPGSEAMGVLIENKGDPTAARSGPAGALPDTSAAMGVVIEYKPGVDSLIDDTLLGESLDMGAGLPTLPTAPQGGVALRGGNDMKQLGDDDQRPASVEIGEIKVHIGTQDMNPSVARNQQFAPAIQAMPPSIMPPSIMPPSIMPPSIMPPSIKPTQGIQGQVAPVARTLQ